MARPLTAACHSLLGDVLPFRTLCAQARTFGCLLWQYFQRGLGPGLPWCLDAYASGGTSPRLECRDKNMHHKALRKPLPGVGGRGRDAKAHTPRSRGMPHTTPSVVRWQRKGLEPARLPRLQLR